MKLGKAIYTRQEVEHLLEASRQQWLLEGSVTPAQKTVPGPPPGESCLCGLETDPLFKAVFETVLGAIFIIDGHGQIINLNPAACRMFGYEPHELLGKSINFIMTDEYGQHHDQHIQGYLQSGEARIIGVAGREYPAVRKDGTKFPIEIAITRTDFGRQEYFVGVIHDITRRKEQERELREARDTAIRSARLKADILTHFSHEIRTPMNGILGCAELLKETSLDEEQLAYLNIVLESANGLLILLNDLVDLSRLESGKIRINNLPFEPRRMFESVCNLFQTQANDKALTLLCDVDADIPDCLVGDEGHLRQLMVNLVQNALKFTLEGSIQMGLEVVSSDNGYILANFYVEDTGVGISPEDQEKIFSNFVQGEYARTSMSGGLGLGLSICRHLVKLMEGEIYVQSEPDKGSCFYFQIPLSLPDED